MLAQDQARGYPGQPARPHGLEVLERRGGQQFDTGLGAWGFPQNQLVYNAVHNSHFHVKEGLNNSPDVGDNSASRQG